MADHATILAKTADYVRSTLAADTSGHDWWHIERVRRTALQLGAAEEADLFVVELAALMHDIADWKFHGGDETADPRAARAWLEKLAVDAAILDHVCEIIGGLSFKGARNEILLRYDADPSIKSKKGKRPIDYVRDEEVRRLLAGQ